jgi:hypothetical protein
LDGGWIQCSHWTPTQTRWPTKNEGGESHRESARGFPDRLTFVTTLHLWTSLVLSFVKEHKRQAALTRREEGTVEIARDTARGVAEDQGERRGPGIKEHKGRVAVARYTPPRGAVLHWQFPLGGYKVSNKYHRRPTCVT